MEFKVIVQSEKFIVLHHERTATYFTIISDNNKLGKTPIDTHTLVSCADTEEWWVDDSWNEVEDVSELEVGELIYINIILKRLFGRKILINQESLGQRGIQLTY